MCAVTALPRLRLLNLVQSRVAAGSVTAFAGVLAATSPALTELHIDSWERWDSSRTDGFGRSVGNPAHAADRQRQVFAALTRLKQLRVLSCRDWGNLVGEQAHSSAAALSSSLPKLTRIAVGQYPCKKCAPEAPAPCPHFPASLPFVEFR